MCVIVPGRDGGSPGTPPGWPPPVCSSLLFSTEAAWLMVCHHESGSALTKLFQLHVNLSLLFSQKNVLAHWLRGQMGSHGIVRVLIRKTKWFGILGTILCDVMFVLKIWFWPNKKRAAFSNSHSKFKLTFKKKRKYRADTHSETFFNDLWEEDVHEVTPGSVTVRWRGKACLRETDDIWRLGTVITKRGDAVQNWLVISTFDGKNPPRILNKLGILGSP